MIAAIRVRVPHRDAEARRRAVVEDVERESVEADELGEAPHDPGEIVERVAECVPRRHRRAAEPREIGRDDVKAVGQARDEVSEHVARAGKAMKQQQLGRLGIPGFAIEDVEPFDVDRAVSHGGHLNSPRG